MFHKKSVPRNFVKFTEKHLCQSHLLNKAADLRPATLLKKRPWHRCFPVNFAKLLRTPFFTKHLWWQLLEIIEKCLISDYLKIQVFIKIGFMLQATHLIICHPELKIYENFLTAISRNKPNMFIAILLNFFIIYFTNFIYSELPNSGTGIFRALSNI